MEMRIQQTCGAGQGAGRCIVPDCHEIFDCSCFTRVAFDSAEASAYYCAPMLTSRLPSRIEPYRLAARGESLNGLMALDRFEWLAAEIGPQSGDCQVWLDFAIDAQGRREIRGRLEAELQLPCRRCLVPMPHDVASEFLLGLITSDTLAAELPHTHEPALVENEQLNLLELVEDELIRSEEHTSE